MDRTATGRKNAKRSLLTGPLKHLAAEPRELQIRRDSPLG